MFSDFLLLAALSVALMAGGAAIVVSDARTRRAAMTGRMQLIELIGGAARPAPPPQHGALMRAPAGKLSQAEMRAIQSACRRLNIPTNYAIPAYLALRVTAAVILAIAGFVLAAVVLKQPPTAVRLLVAAMFAGGGWILPAVLLREATKRHTAAAAAGLPEALELLVVCVEAGLSLEDAISRITEDLKWSRPALAEELALTSADLRILPDRDIALMNLAERVDAPSVRSVVTSLSQTLRYGTPLAQALRVTAAELRNDSLLQMEERANRLPTLLTLPMMLFIMPTIFLIIGGPAVLRLIDLFSR